MATSTSTSVIHQILDFNIDHYISPWIPQNRVGRLPSPISRFLGYRSTPKPEPVFFLQWPITFLATVAVVCIAGAKNAHDPVIVAHQPPTLIASLGASAVLTFNTIKSPLSQPRNAIIGNTLCAVMGVSMAKAFARYGGNADLLWVSAALACALASLLMSITNTVHAPGGATAVIACIDTHALAMGWSFVWLVLLDTVILVIVACLFNNIFRTYPVYWWTPGDVGAKLRAKRNAEKNGGDGAKAAEEGHADHVQSPPADGPGLKDSNGETAGNRQENEREKVHVAGHGSDSESDSRTLHRETTGTSIPVGGTGDGQAASADEQVIRVPPGVTLSEEEMLLLERIRERIRFAGERVVRVGLSNAYR